MSSKVRKGKEEGKYNGMSGWYGLIGRDLGAQLSTNYEGTPYF